MASDQDLALVPGSGCDERLFAPQVDALRVRQHATGPATPRTTP